MTVRVLDLPLYKFKKICSTLIYLPAKDAPRMPDLFELSCITQARSLAVCKACEPKCRLIQGNADDNKN